MTSSASTIVIYVLGVCASLAIVTMMTVTIRWHRCIDAINTSGWFDHCNYRTERSWLRLHVTAITINITGLLLISLVSMAHVGLLVCCVPSKSPLYLTSEPALAVPESEHVERRHKELVNAIQRIGESMTRPRGSDPFPLETTASDEQSSPGLFGRNFPVLPIVGFVCFTPALWALLYFLRSSQLLTVTQYKAARAAVLTLGSLAGGVSLLQGFSLIKDVKSLVQITYSPHIEQKSGRGSPGPRGARGPRGFRAEAASSSPAEFDCGEGDSQHVKPFKTGHATLEEQTKRKLDVIIGTLRDRQRSSNLLSFVLIGSADKRSLRPRLHRYFGSNAGLAQARVNAVKEYLIPKFESGLSILALQAGPSQTGIAPSVTELELDRTVQLCAYWSPRP